MILNPVVMKKGVYVWEKYNTAVVSYKENQTRYSNGLGSVQAPSDADTSVKYEGYTFDSKTGAFTMTGEGATKSPYYLPSKSSSNTIYECTLTSGSMSGRPSSYNVYKITAVPASNGKGDTCYGTVTAETESAYPANGELDGYWYVLVGRALY